VAREVGFDGEQVSQGRGLLQPIHATGGKYGEARWGCISDVH
jgi:hypothetical protein